MNVNCHMAGVYIVPLVTALFMFTLYVLYTVLRQRYRQRPWRFILARGANLAVTAGCWAFLNMLSSRALPFVRRGIPLIIICGVLFLCWFGVFYAVRLRKTRHESPAPEKSAVRAALTDVTILAVMVAVNMVWCLCFKFMSRDLYPFSLAGLPMLYLLVILDRFPFFFSWGKEVTQYRRECGLSTGL